MSEKAVSKVEEVLRIMSENWVQIVVAALLAAMFVLGYSRGLIKMSAALVSIVAALVLTKMLLPYALEYIRSNEGLHSSLTAHFSSMLEPEQAAEASRSSVDVFYELIGIDRLTEYLGEQAAALAVTVVVFIALLILTSLAVRILFKVLDLIARLPGLSFVNRFLGGLLGLAEGLLYVWIAILVVGILPESGFSISVASQFSEPGSWLSYLKDANLIARIFEAML